jgi:hypothetical protein
MANIINRDDGIIISFSAGELLASGPQVPVVLTAPTKVLTAETKRHKTLALINPAMPLSAIDAQIAVTLGLKPVGQVEFTNGFDRKPQLAAGYKIFAFLANGYKAELIVPALSLSPVTMILGRDFLAGVRLEYDGPQDRVRLFGKPDKAHQPG